ncbi:Rhodanese domain protein [Desulfonatronospira thiodismutans ASO3-1]|uniref:Rhodanese domain protein n=1 Tax=Desulfonatronospira thiodismutans ASO3-1 TaxID=555779 RepID=D6ST24_9BACT|nr:rhodanese-like domain-containing protein [Desulfonatronospira thiodismutans]EFI33840.1 Rhodanese domain protein [Desulfonatronospira thiodismutans ASO3-1]
MGYENVVVFPEGDEHWADQGYKLWTIEDITEPDEAEVAEAEEAAEPSDIKEGEFPGSIDEDFFVELMETDPGSIRLIDVRDEDEFSRGHLPQAERMNVDEIRANMDEFDDEKPIVLICATGARSGEAYFTFQDQRPELDVYYLDANVSYGEDGSFEIE